MTVLDASDPTRPARRSFSFEFFPPKDEAGEEQLWTAIRELEPLQPTFVSVTYGAGGTTRDRTVGVTARIARETSLTPMAHLTCVGHSVEELRTILGQYADAGVRHVLALRGDPPEGPGAEWVAHPEGLQYATELVELAKEVGDFHVTVAAFPEKHPRSESLARDAEVLAAKARAGADLAITQFFFRARDYVELVDRVRDQGVDIPIIPGIMPVLSLRSVERMAELSGAEIPAEVRARLAPHEDDPKALRAEGIAIATELCEELLAGDVPGLHFITLNRSTATREIWSGLGTLV
ncbi:methylenetetrahydrofolate reductase [NAD(P)H] [Nocardioidaceae bacterium]|nr:methylenetetrahydrofolate reductase [NAD(P)H] [Nocardioidaceae bacterium]